MAYLYRHAFGTLFIKYNNNYYYVYIQHKLNDLVFFIHEYSTLSLTLSWPDFPQLFAVYRKTILLIDQSNHLHSYYI